MAYSDFTLEAVRREFQLEIVESAGIFSEASTVVPQEHFMAELEEKVELAISSGTEKARSELIITDVLFQLREHFNRRISFFSGIEFSVDTEWQFLKLEAQKLYIDRAIYSIGQCDKILGILSSMVEQKV